jgi:hypothetical protein
MSSRQVPNLPGTVAVLFPSESAQYSYFTKDLEALKLPEGTVKDFEFSPDFGEGRNKLVRRALDRGSYWIWFITEGHSFEPEIVETLLSRNETIISPIVLSRDAPFLPESFVALSAGGEYVPLMLNDVTGPGTMIEIRAAVATGMLIRSAVLKEVKEPWFRTAPDGNDYTYFCERAREAGFQAYVDTSVRIGNRLTASMYPIHRGGKWELAVGVGNDIEMNVRIKQG